MPCDVFCDLSPPWSLQPCSHPQSSAIAGLVDPACLAWFVEEGEMHAGPFEQKVSSVANTLAEEIETSFL